jgi:hypothetical protein
MRKLMMLVAMAAMVLLVAVPAIAQISQEIGNVSQEISTEAESGDVSLSGSATSTGNNSNQCVTPEQFGNTGTPQDQAGIFQYASKSGDIKTNSGSLGILQFGSQSGDIQAEGGTPMTFEPALESSCGQDVQQSSAVRG